MPIIKLKYPNEVFNLTWGCPWPLHPLAPLPRLNVAATIFFGDFSHNGSPLFSLKEYFITITLSSRKNVTVWDSLVCGHQSLPWILGLIGESRAEHIGFSSLPLLKKILILKLGVIVLWPKWFITYSVSQKSVTDLSKYCSHLFIVSVEKGRHQRLPEDHLRM